MNQGCHRLVISGICGAIIASSHANAANFEDTSAFLSGSGSLLPIDVAQVPQRSHAFGETLALSRDDLMRGGFEQRGAAEKRGERGKADGPILRVPIELLPTTALTGLLSIAPKSVPALGPPTVPAPGVPAWTAIGPFPIPNGETQDREDPVSGRVTAIAVDPGDANVAYVGTAQGGLYRTLNGGSTWEQLMDHAAAGTIGTPLAIGAVAVNPSNPQTVFVGTGEGNNNFDGAFGTGFYIITNAKTSSAVLTGPLNFDSGSNDVFLGRAIAAIAVDPTNGNNVFCGTSFGFRGFYSTDGSPARPPRGLYRSTNALATKPTWSRLTVGAGTNSIITSVVVDPGNPNHVIVAVQGETDTDGSGIYVSDNALAATPTFTLKHATPLNTFVKLAINRSGSPAIVTVVAASGESNSGSDDGRLYKSSDGGATWLEMTAARGFAGAQGFYNVAVAVDPADRNKIYLGGAVPHFSTANGTFQYSSDGGTTFTPSVTGLHPDSHTIAVAPSNPSVVYTGNDGGVWKSTDAGHTWVSLNNSTFSATQFSDLAVHPTDRNFSIGGTQDNGTQMLNADGTFTRVDFGDGGQSLIDRNASGTSAATLYHTYYNRRNDIIGTARILNVGCAQEGNWTFHGVYQGSVDSTIYCDGTKDTFNGSALTDAVNFYAPQALGPGNPNTWYFGTDRLYRSTNRADTAAVVSQVLDQTSSSPAKGTPISAIGISAQDDKVRLVGLNNGKVFATTTGSSALLQIAGPGASNGNPATPPAQLSRIAVDPTNPSVAYLVYCGYGDTGSPMTHVWKTTNLNALNSTPPGVVTLAPASAGLPDVSANAIAIDPLNSNYLYLGTDVGVFSSTDGGAHWSTYGAGLPNLAVFGLQLQSPNRILRAATHGRGIYDAPVANPPAPPAPTPTPRLTPTPTPKPTPSPKATATPIPTSTPTPTATATATPTATATASPTPKPTPTATPVPPARAQNISTRLDVGTAEKRAIGGFIVTGKTAKRVIIRAVGPSLAQAGISGVLADPVLELHRADGAVMARNDNWRETQEADIKATGVAPASDAEAALIATLVPGNYTAVVGGNDGGTGVGLVELYDLDGNASSSRLANISTRGLVRTGENVIIGGFILGSDQGAADILVRGLGPSLAQLGVTDALADPTLELRNSHGTVMATNDDWKHDATQAARISATTIPPTNDREAAIVTTLAPGAYTAVLAGKNGGVGVGIVEVYNLSPNP